MLLIRDKWKQRYRPRPFNRFRQRTLMFGAGAGNTARKYLATFRNETAQGISVFIIYLEFLHTEFADLFFKKDLSAAPSAALITVPSVNILPAIHS
jgi:hypothetical protein